MSGPGLVQKRGIDSYGEQTLNAAIGFTISRGMDEHAQQAASPVMQKLLRRFDMLTQVSLEIGVTNLQLWGRGKPEDWSYQMPDGAWLVLIGSPVGVVSWERVAETLEKTPHPEQFEPPWDGRYILLKISSSGHCWTMWNDWVGSIPLFYTPIPGGWLASTLEPVVVTATNQSATDFFMPGLVSLLVHGHYIGDWTLFKNIKSVCADSVTIWDENKFRTCQLNSVTPSTRRWEQGWDELVDEIYELSYQAVAAALKSAPQWILPLSGGLDSRLIAAVGAEEGVNLRAYTYGPAGTKDTLYASRVARSLDLPWQRVDLGSDYLVRYTQFWADWFGSSLHFHGMYQMPFMDALQSEPAGPIASGYLGEALAGGHLRSLIAAHSGEKPTQLLPDGWTHWSAYEVVNLMKVPVTEALDEMAVEIARQIETVPGAWYQRLMFLDLWNRQRLFISFQPTLCDYWRGVATPFLNRAYARFCLSLPQVALEHRRLQADMYRRYFGLLATIPGTYGREPYILTGSHLLKRRIAAGLPRRLLRGSWREFAPVPIRMDQDCVQQHGWAALWPIEEVWSQLEELMDVEQIEAVYTTLLDKNEWKSMRKLQSVQSFAYGTMNGLISQ